MNDQAIRFRLGVFLLLAMILLAVLILMFGGLPNYFKKSTGFTIVFTNAPGINPGTPVKRSGIRIGEVRAIRLDNDTGKVSVGVQIEENYSIRKSDRPTIQQGLLGGDATIAFLPPDDPKTAEPGMVAPGSTIDGFLQADAGALLQRTTDLMPQAQEALIEIRKAFSRLEKAGPDLENLFRDFRELTKATREAFPELKRTNDEIRDLIKVARQTIPDFKKTGDEISNTARIFGKVAERVDGFLMNNEEKLAKTLDRLQDTLKKASDALSDENQKNFSALLKNVRDASEKLDGFTKDTQAFLKEGAGAMKSFNDTLVKTDDLMANLTKATKPLGDRGPVILKNVEETTVNLNRTMADLREILQAVARNDGTVQKLLSDPTLYNNLNDSAAMVTKILPRLDRVLRDVEIFADKIARHPESLGISGVIRPSSGLKENPTVIPYYRMAPGSIIDP